MIDYENVLKQITVLQSLYDAHTSVEAGKLIAEPLPDAPKETVEAQKMTARNVALAGSGLKADLMGTLSTLPVLDERALVAIDFNEVQAADIVKERDTIRADAFALTDLVAPEVKP